MDKYNLTLQKRKKGVLGLVALATLCLYLNPLSLLQAQNDSSAKKSEQTIKTFFVGDLSFALEGYWEEIIAKKSNNPKGVNKINLTNKDGVEHTIYIFEVGDDGTYTSTKNESISTDSGTIGAAPIDFWGEIYPEEVDSIGIVRKMDPKDIKKTDNTIEFGDIIFQVNEN
jgi:hypothetical protein